MATRAVRLPAQRRALADEPGAVRDGPAGARHAARSAGPDRGPRAPEVVEVMREVGIDLAGATPSDSPTSSLAGHDASARAAAALPYIPGRATSTGSRRTRQGGRSEERARSCANASRSWWPHSRKSSTEACGHDRDQRLAHVILRVKRVERVHRLLRPADAVPRSRAIPPGSDYPSTTSADAPRTRNGPPKHRRAPARTHVENAAGPWTSCASAPAAARTSTRSCLPCRDRGRDLAQPEQGPWATAMFALLPRTRGPPPRWGNHVAADRAASGARPAFDRRPTTPRRAAQGRR